MSSSKKATANKESKEPLKRRASKLEKQKNFLLELASQLDPRWRLCCAPSMERNLFGRRDDFFYTFPSAFVHKLLIDYIETPGKIRSKTISNLAQQINEKFSLIDRSEFLKFEFLSSDNEFHSKLKDSSLSKFKELKDLSRRREVDEEFFRMLSDGRHLAALVHLWGENLGILLLNERDAAAANRSFSSSTQARGYRYIMNTSGVVTELDKQKLANHIYSRELERLEDQTDDNRFERAFQSSKDSFSTIQERLKEYRGYLDKRYNMDGDRALPGRASWATADAMKQKQYLPMLINSQFSRIDRGQESDYFRWAELPSNHFFW